MYMPFLTMCRAMIWHRWCQGKEASVVRPMKFRNLGVGFLMLLFGLERLNENQVSTYLLILSFRIYSCFYWNLVINMISRCVQLMICVVGCKCGCYVLHSWLLLVGCGPRRLVFTSFHCMLKICSGTYQYRLSELDLVLWWATYTVKLLRCRIFCISYGMVSSRL
jgi:hypothetical protein